MEMKEMLNREGRDAKNLLVYTPPTDDANQHERNQPSTHRRPPVAPAKASTSSNVRPITPKSSAHSPARSAGTSQCSGPRVRSASTGRDKRSELQARYWALLFGNLQRAVNEIYQTVECYENLSSCKEAILVLENYVRDFKALSEWFKVSWDYESRPLQQRPHSLAWEVRKSNPLPRLRARSLSSPSGSGKSSPCQCSCGCSSGKNSPCCGGDNQSPRKVLRPGDALPKGAMRVNVRELFAAHKRTPTEQRVDNPAEERQPAEPAPATEAEPPPDVRSVLVQHQYAQTALEDDHLTLADIRERIREREYERYQRESPPVTPPLYEDNTMTLANSPNVSYSPHILIVPQANYTHMANVSNDVNYSPHPMGMTNGLNYAYCPPDNGNASNYQYAQTVNNYSHMAELPNGYAEMSNAQNYQHIGSEMPLKVSHYQQFPEVSTNGPAYPPPHPNVANVPTYSMGPQQTPYLPVIPCTANDVNYNNVSVSYCSPNGPNVPNDPHGPSCSGVPPMYTNASNVPNLPLFSVPPPPIYHKCIQQVNYTTPDLFADLRQEPPPYKKPRASSNRHSKRNPIAIQSQSTETSAQPAQPATPRDTQTESKEHDAATKSAASSENKPEPPSEAPKLQDDAQPPQTEPSDNPLDLSIKQSDTSKANSTPLPKELKKPISEEKTVETTTPRAVEMTIAKLNAMENELLQKEAKKQPTLPTTAIKPAVVAIALDDVKEFPPPKVAEESSKKAHTTAEPTASATQSSPLKYSSVLNRPAVPQPVTTKTAVLRQNANATKPNAKASASTTTKSTYNRAVTSIAKVPNAMRATATRTGAPAVVPVRPSSRTEGYGPMNVASRISARSRTVLDINGNDRKPQPQPQRPASRQQNGPPTQSNLASSKSSREDIGSSSSTLKASNNSLANGPTVAEAKHKTSAPNDGWLTVKNRRRSSLHWANRFNQPTGYASLPTLALLNEKLEEEKQLQKKLQLQQQKQQRKPPVPKHPSGVGCAATKATTASGAAPKNAKVAKTNERQNTKVNLRPEIKNAKAKVNSLPTVRKSATTIAVSAVQKPPERVAPQQRQPAIKRQKSDVTGLKLTSLHKEYMRSEKNAQRQQTANTSEVPAVAGEMNGPTHGPTIELTKIDIKIQTNRDFSKTIGDLYDSIAHGGKVSRGNKRITKVHVPTTDSKLSSCDEFDEAQTHELDCDAHQRLLVEEQESLERQIRELESTEIDVDTETDETDCEVLLETEHEGDGTAKEDRGETSSVLFVPLTENGGFDKIDLELHYEAFLMEMSWMEREECLRTLQAYVTRHPGRAQLLHQKLSSPSRRRSFHETLKKYQAKQARAQEKREMLQKEKAIKIQQLLARVEDVKAAKAQLIEDKRLKMEERLQRAAENREQYLRQKIEKAHDEEKKLKEINFIKSLEAQNKRLDLIESTKDVEVRLQDLEQERQKRLEEKAAKEAAVERRRQELEKERQRKLEKMNESRLEKEQRIGKMQEQKEQQRQALAREKARDRVERLQALQAQKQLNTEELQRKILQKQIESARRHEENIEHIRQRALELTIPNRNVEESANATPLDGDTETVTSYDGDMSTSTPSELGGPSRSHKKKLRKLRNRLKESSDEYIAKMEPLDAFRKRNSQVPKFLGLILKGGGPQGYERPLGQLLRLINKGQVDDFLCFMNLDGLGTIASCVVTKGLEEYTDVPRKAVVLGIQLYRNACTLCPQIARHALLGNSIVLMLDALVKCLQNPEEKSAQHPVDLATELLLALSVGFAPPYCKKHTHPKVLERLPDLISYAVLVGALDAISQRLHMISEPIENDNSVTLALLAILGLLTRFVDIYPSGQSEASRFIRLAKTTEMFGVISMLNACAIPVGDFIPPRTISVAAATFNLLVSVAMMDSNLLQECFAEDAIAMKFLDVATVLVRHVGFNFDKHQYHDATAVIIDLIATLSFFCVNNKKNIDRVLSEEHTTLVKYLTKMPSQFDVVVHPFLIVLTYENPAGREKVARETNMNFLDKFLKTETAKANLVIKQIQDMDSPTTSSDTTKAAGKVEKKGDDVKVEEAKVEEAKVDEEKGEEVKVDEVKVVDPKGDDPKVDEAKEDDAKVDDPKVVEPQVEVKVKEVAEVVGEESIC